MGRMLELRFWWYKLISYQIIYACTSSHLWCRFLGAQNWRDI